MTFQLDFQAHGIGYQVSALTKSELYSFLEPKLNCGEVELLDSPQLIEQALGLVLKGAKIDHLSGEFDDVINAVAGTLYLATAKVEITDDMYAWGEPLSDHSLASLTSDDWRSGVEIQ